MTKNILLLTATVRPPAGAIGLVRTDVEARMSDYLSAMGFYLAELRSRVFDNIVFVDNSDSSLGFLEALVDAHVLSNQVELISYAGLDYPPTFGRTFGEFKLIDEVYALSKTLRNIDPGTVVWKITGRYTVRNIGKLVRSRPHHIDLYCNARKVPSKYLDIYCISWNQKAYSGFIKQLYEKLNVSHTLVPGENLFYTLLFDDPRAAQITVEPRFRITPYITGIRGFNNAGFNVGKDIFKYYMRVVLRNLAPWFWV